MACGRWGLVDWDAGFKPKFDSLHIFTRMDQQLKDREAHLAEVSAQLQR